MVASVRVTREEALDLAAGVIGSALRARFHLEPGELFVTWTLDPDNHAMLHVETRGLGAYAIEDAEFDQVLTALRDEHADVLDSDRWAAVHGEDETVREMPEDAFAARMRGKVK